MGEDLKVYCLDCDQPACVDCIMETKHKDHTFRRVAEVADRMRAAMGHILATEKKAITKAEAKFEELDKSISHINKEERLAVESCYKRAEELKSQVDMLAQLTEDKIRQRIKDNLRMPMEDNLRCTTANIDNQKQYLKAVEKLYDANNDNQLITNYKQMLSIRRPSVEKELILSNYNIDNKRLFERSNVDLTDLVDVDLIIGKVPTTSKSDKQELADFEPPARFYQQTPKDNETDWSYRRRILNSSATASMTSSGYHASLFRVNTINEEEDSQNYDISGKRMGTSLMDLHSPSVKNKLKIFFSKPFKKKD